MIRNYFKIALRNLMKNKAHSFINLTGLMIGISCCMLISLYVKNELSYDRFQEKGNRIARMIMEYSMGGNVNAGNYTSTKVGPSFKQNFPEVENFVRMARQGRIVKYKDKVFVEKRFVYADSTFFDVFPSFVLLEGQVEKVLAAPKSVVVTRSAAEKYFGSEDPVGKTIKVSSAETDYLVTGVVENCPENSQIKFDFIASFSSLGESQEETYWNANYTTYLLLKNESSFASFDGKIRDFMKREMTTEMNGNDYLTYHPEPYYTVHLHSEHAGFEPNGNIVYVYILCIVALLILLIACITFINLCTAKSVERAKEIGIRKVAGAGKPQIFWQFIGESFVLSVLSTAVSYFVVRLSLPYFNDVTDRTLHFSDLFSFSLIGVVVLIVCSISFFAGAYPALVLSAFQPVKVLKGVFRNTGSGLVLRKSLFVFQFVISVFLIVTSFIIQKQLDYFQNKRLGFDKEHVLVLPVDQKVSEGFNALRSELKKNASVLAVSKGDFQPCNIMGGYSMYTPEMPPGKVYSVHAGTIDEEYLKTCGIEIVAGADLTSQDVTEAMREEPGKSYYHYVINESAARQLGWTTKEAIGKKLFLDSSRPGEVKAVASDFHFASLHTPIKPLVLFPGNYGATLLVKITAGNPSQAIAGIGGTWKKLMPHRPFEYTFLNENYNAMYASEINLGKAISAFTLLAVLLACLGLFGLSSYSIQQRAKEIGILKILGAPVYNIVARLSKNFIGLVMLAIIISLPLAWWSMTKWLRDFSYRIEMNVWLFVLPALCALLIAIVTVSFKALQAASVNPVKNLRTE